AAGAGAAALGGASLGAMAGAGAPSLGSATKLIPSPSDVPAGEPRVSAGARQPVAVGVGATSAYVDVDEEHEDSYDAEETDGGAANNGGGLPPEHGDDSGQTGDVKPVPPPPGRDPSAPPRVQIRGDRSGRPSAKPPRRTIPTMPSGPSATARVAGRLLPVLIGVVVIVAIVVALLFLTQSGKSPATKHHAAKKPAKPTAASNAHVKVSILNGTAFAGLADKVSKYLTKAGYTVPKAAVTNAATQTTTATQVEYMPGHRSDANKVAAQLTKSTNVPIRTVSAASQQSIVSCGTPTPGNGQQGHCPATVIVVAGTDLHGATGSKHG
ncbi:MAG: LytR C-terminal domain-containing protein, partial [Solirubrobacterales bacterium]|nr:LytR C-terminal domain-containing protein [Solirubrobacterales bacterium]